MPSAREHLIVNYAHVAPLYDAALGSADLTAEDAVLLKGAVGALESAEQTPDVISAPNDRAAALLQTYLAKRAAQSGVVRPTDFSDAVEAKFRKQDVGWVKAALPYIREKLGIEHRDQRPPLSDAVDVVANKTRVALLGDWGTNLYGAPAAASSIAADGQYQVLLHVGDVYYSGSFGEVEEKFLVPWRRMQAGNPTALSRACNSNHEMFSGGAPYFTKTLTEFGQASSTFAMRNDDWLLIGLDTAYHDHRLDADQIDWLTEVTADVGTRRVVLFTHHQPFSHFNEGGPALLGDLESFLGTGRLFAWYWGHEHLHAFYEPHARWGFHGRCVGHGGFPAEKPAGLDGRPRMPLPKGLSFVDFAPAPDVPRALLLDGPNEYLGARSEQYGPNGYMRLEFDGPHLYEVSLASDGTQLWRGELT